MRSQDDDPHGVEKADPNELSEPWHHQQQSKEICEDARGDEEGAANQQHRTMGEFDIGDLAGLQPQDDLAPDHPALAGHEASADHSGHDHSQHRPPEPDRITDNPQEDELNDRQSHKEKQSDHRSDVRRCPPEDSLRHRIGSHLVDASHPPSIDRLSRLLPESLPSALRVLLARSAVDRSRLEPTVDPVEEAMRLAAGLAATRQRAVVNATGVILHTNLGRAPSHEAAAAAAFDAATRYTNLELTLDAGERGGRTSYVTALLRALTGADDALVLNNNAGALFLTLIAMAAGRSVPVSRGELIEIGGSYRLPDLMSSTGTRLVEVGTTNRTRIDDYRSAIDETTALLLKVHPSNYRIEGFSEDTDLEPVVALAHELGLPAVFDAGSGLLDDRTPWLTGPTPAWLEGEPGIVQSLEAGADLVLFSGDKLLGGPQAGIIVGDGDLVAGLRRHPVARALRLDGPTLAGLECTLESYADRRAAELPLWTMATLAAEDLLARAQAVIGNVPSAVIVDGASTIGAGSVPGARIPGPVIRLAGQGESGFSALLGLDTPIVARREAGDLIIDLRTVPPDEDGIVAGALARLCRS